MIKRKSNSSSPIRRITIAKDWHGSTVNVDIYDLYSCNGRRDQYRITLNGKPFSAKMGLTKLLEHIRRTV